MRWLLALFLLLPSIIIGGETNLTCSPPILDQDGSCLGPDETCISDLAGYRFYRDTVAGVSSDFVNRIADVTACIYTDLGLVDGVYYYVSTAYDTSGNESITSNEVSKTILNENNPPSTGEGMELVLVDESPPPNNIIAYWPLDEISGANDVSGNGNNGVLQGGPVWQDGYIVFDGVDDYVAISSLDIVGSELTIAAKMNSNNFQNCSGYDCRIISKAIGIWEQDHYWMLSPILVDSQVRLRTRIKAGGSTTTLKASTGDMFPSVDYHVAATYDGADIRLYLDGEQVGIQAKTGMIDVNPVVSAQIGSNPPGVGSQCWDGTISDVRIYDRALSQSEIQGLM